MSGQHTPGPLNPCPHCGAPADRIPYPVVIACSKGSCVGWQYAPIHVTPAQAEFYGYAHVNDLWNALTLSDGKLNAPTGPRGLQISKPRIRRVRQRWQLDQASVHATPRPSDDHVVRAYRFCERLNEAAYIAKATGSAA